MKKSTLFLAFAFLAIATRPVHCENTAPAPGDDTAPAPGDDTVPAPSETTAPASGEAAAPASGEDTVPAPSETTAPASGEAAAPASGEATAPASGEAPAPASGEATAPASGEAAASASTASSGEGSGPGSAAGSGSGSTEEALRSPQDVSNQASDLRDLIIFRVRKLRNAIKRGILLETATQLQRLRASAANLQANAIRTQLNFSQRSFRQAQVLRNQFRTWVFSSTARIRTLSNGNVDLVSTQSTIVDDLVSNYETQLETCISQTATVSQEYQTLVFESATQYGTVIDDVSSASEVCFTSSNSIADSFACAESLRSDLNQLRYASNDFNRLIQKGATRFTYSYSTNSCFNVIRVSFNTESARTFNQIVTDIRTALSA